MHGCVRRLLAGSEVSKQGDVECLIRLMSTAGQQLDATPKAMTHMGGYFERITALSKNLELESRLRFMLQASTQALNVSCWCRQAVSNAV